MTIMARLPGFDVCQIKYWEKNVHRLVIKEKENNRLQSMTCFYLLDVATSVMTSSRTIKLLPPISQARVSVTLVLPIAEN
jgi:hypothetical protein